MANIQIHDRPSLNTYIKAAGTGLKDDPYVINIDANLQDQTTPPLILPMVQLIAVTELSLDTVEDSYSITVLSTTGIVADRHLRIINSLADRYYFGTVLSVLGNVVTLDTPIDYPYLAGSEVTISNTNLAVDGSVTPQVFTLRTGSPSIPSALDITRLMITCTCNSAVDLSLFGNIPRLTRGIVLRQVNGEKRNIFNLKCNCDMLGIGIEWTPFIATNPAQGLDGFGWRLTFAGQDKIGVALRMEATGNLQMIVQDDLTGLVTLRVILEGHTVDRLWSN